MQARVWRKDPAMTDRLDRPVILLGFGRSGSSIIADAVFQHDELAYLSNYHVMFPRSRLINYVRPLLDNPLWAIKGQKKQLNEVSRLNRYAFRAAEAYAFLNHVTGRDFRRDFLYGVRADAEERERIRRVFRQLVRAQFRRRLGFKITGPSRLGYLASLFPDARFVWIVRDPLPNIRSLLKVDFYQPRKHELWWYGEGVYSEREKGFAEENRERPELIAALQYFKVNQIHRAEADSLGLWDNILTVRYADFVRRPEREIGRILEFAGLRPDRHVSAFLESNRIFSRDEAQGHYFSAEMDEAVARVALHGIAEEPLARASHG